MNVPLVAPRTHCNKILPHVFIVQLCPVVSCTAELSFILQKWNTSGASEVTSCGLKRVIAGMGMCVSFHIPSTSSDCHYVDT